MRAAKNADSAVIQEMDSKKCSSGFGSGCESFEEANLKGHHEVVKDLLSRGLVGDQDIQRGLILASSAGHVDCVNVLIDHGAQVNVPDKKGRLALIMASMNGHTEIVKVLVGHKARVNVQDKKGRLALVMASINGYTKVVETLLNLGANINAMDSRRRCVLIGASIQGHVAIVLWNMTNFIHCTHFIIIDDITRCDIIRIKNTLEDKC